jgi:hypothetical protein
MLRGKDYRKFFFNFRLCLDAGMKLKFSAFVKRAGKSSTATLLVTTLICLSALTACAQMKSWLTQPGPVEQLAPATTNLVTLVVTNTIILPAQTNAATGEIIPGSTQVQLSTNVTAIVHPATYFTNVALAPIVQNSIAAADTAASAAGIPWSHTVAEIVLALIGGVLSWANFRNRQRLLSEIGDHTNTQGALNTAQQVAQTLVQNFEQLRQVALTVPGYTRQMDDKVMTAIQAAQQIAGVKDQINALVDEHTSTTLPG